MPALDPYLRSAVTAAPPASGTTTVGARHRGSRGRARATPAASGRPGGDGYGAGVGSIDASAWIAPTAVVTGDVTLGPGARVLHGAVLNGDRGPVVLGADVVIMENAVLRGRPEHPLLVGDAVLVGPHAHLNGARIEDEVFVATGVSVFAGAVAGARSELRVGSVLHVNSHLPADTVVPIGWIAAGTAVRSGPAPRVVGGSGRSRLPGHDVRRGPRHVDARDHAPPGRGLRSARRRVAFYRRRGVGR